MKKKERSAKTSTLELALETDVLLSHDLPAGSTLADQFSGETERF